MKPHHDIPLITQHFAMPGEFKGFKPCGDRHINDTYEVNFSQGGVPVRYIIQRINHQVFKQPEKVMENIRRVTEHIANKLKESKATDPNRKALTLIPCRNGKMWHVDSVGNHWRGYVYVEGATAHNHVDDPASAEEAARAFGEFQSYLCDIPGERLHDTIPNFHHTRSRYDAFMKAVDEDKAGRVKDLQKEIAFCVQREAIVDRLLDLQAKSLLHERVTHNDTKINNVMIDNVTGMSTCIVDLDTVMPGLVLYDFGDLVRTTTISTAEDEIDFSKVKMRMNMFEAMVRGYLKGANFLTDMEISQLAFSGRLITFELALRFLTDYIKGDHYFKIHRPEHNLDRFRVQAALVRSMEEQEEEMEKVVKKMVVKSL